MLLRNHRKPSSDGRLPDAGGRPRIFVVFGAQRSGSTLVASRLNSHPYITCHEEVLLPEVAPGPSLSEWLAANRYPPLLRVLPSMRCSFLSSLVEVGPGAETRAIGMKIMYNQISLWPKLGYVAPPLGRLLNDTRMLNWLSGNDALVIHTLRRNHLKMLVSHLHAARTGQFHYRHGASEDSVGKFTLPLTGLTARLRRIEYAEAAARQSIRDMRSIEVWYEDYIGPGREQIDADLCIAMGQQLPEGGLSSSLSKVSSDNMREVLTNYDDVITRLSGTRFERFLD